MRRAFSLKSRMTIFKWDFTLFLINPRFHSLIGDLAMPWQNTWISADQHSKTTSQTNQSPLCFQWSSHKPTNHHSVFYGHLTNQPINILCSMVTSQTNQSPFCVLWSPHKPTNQHSVFYGHLTNQPITILCSMVTSQTNQSPFCVLW